MNPSTDRRRIPLKEYQTARLGHDVLTDQQGKHLYEVYGKQVGVAPPSFINDNQWELTSQGWVGYIPLDAEVGIALEPKVPIGNLFRMLEYAYDLESFRFLDDLTDCESLEDMYERLANILAQRVLNRARKGLYRDYVRRAEELPYLRGRWDVRESMRRYWEPRIHCRYEEHTADVEENVILSWTLRTIIRSHICSERVLPTVRRAYRTLQNAVQGTQVTASQCIGRLYTRLNVDYQPMHALCRFFLEQSGPSHRAGDRRIMPFLLNMNALYERFVARWLQAHAPEGLLVRDQRPVRIDEQGKLEFRIDIELIDAETNVTRHVIDTKYKVPDSVSSADAQQVIAYAVAKRCREAILVYPRELEFGLDHTFEEGIRVRSIVFAVQGDLDQAGEYLLTALAG